jgi:hypothetical protein
MAANLQQIVQEQISFLSEEELDQVLRFLRSLSKQNKARESRPISKVFEDIRADIPELKWDDMPTDGAENLNHYLYGEPEMNKDA